MNNLHLQCMTWSPNNWVCALRGIHGLDSHNTFMQREAVNVDRGATWLEKSYSKFVKMCSVCRIIITRWSKGHCTSRCASPLSAPSICSGSRCMKWMSSIFELHSFMLHRRLIKSFLSPERNIFNFKFKHQLCCFSRSIFISSSCTFKNNSFRKKKKNECRKCFEVDWQALEKFICYSLWTRCLVPFSLLKDNHSRLTTLMWLLSAASRAEN